MAGAGDGDRHLGNALDLALAVNLRVDGLGVAVGELGGVFRLAEIDAAGELADADDVDAVGNAPAFERRGVGELAVEEAGADVGEEREVLAERQQRGA